MADQFADYLKLLAHIKPGLRKAEIRPALQASGVQIKEDEPLPGYYRMAAKKGGPLLPVAIWRDESGELNILRNGETVKAEWVWPKCFESPIPYEWYEAYTERGEKWPDDCDVSEIYAKASGHPVPREKHSTPIDELPPSGHNNPPEETELGELLRQIEAASSAAGTEYKTIKDDTHAAAAQAARSRLNELSNSADKKRESEKRPHLEASKAIDAKWQPLVKLAKAGADAIRAAVNVFENKKFQAEQKAQREAEEARAKAEAEGKPLPEPVAPTPITSAGTIKGATGRAATIRTIKVAHVVDYDKAYQHMKAIPEVKKLIDTIAQRLVRAGETVPGVEVSEQRDVA